MSDIYGKRQYPTQGKYEEIITVIRFMKEKGDQENV